MELVIKEGTDRSDALLLPDRMVGINAPTGWSSAPLCFRVSMDGVSYKDLVDEKGELVQVAMQPPGSFMAVPEVKGTPFAAGSHVIFVSGTPEQPVPQEQDRVFSVWTATPPAQAGRSAEHRDAVHKRDEQQEKRDQAPHARDTNRHK